VAGCFFGGKIFVVFEILGPTGFFCKENGKFGKFGGKMFLDHRDGSVRIMFGKNGREISV